MKTTKTIFTGLCAFALVSCGSGDKASGPQNAFYKLSNGSGMEVTVTNYGGRIQSIIVPDKDGVPRDVVLGFDTVEEYYPENNASDFGAAIGRYANRISGGRLVIDGTEYALPRNNGRNCLHGGPTGWQYQPYTVVESGPAMIRLRMDSPDGDNAFPGAVTAFVTYTLTDDNRIDISYEATTTAPTVINMTNHSYFNLSGDPASHCIEDDFLYINSSAFTPTDFSLIPTGEILPTEGTPLDFSMIHRIGDEIEMDFEALKFAGGYDHNWILDTKGDDGAIAAELYCEKTGIVLDVYTDEPGIQVYSGNFLDGTVTGKGGVKYARRAGICLETQHYPDSPNRPEFPSTVLRPGETYTSHCVFAFSVKQ